MEDIKLIVDKLNTQLEVDNDIFDAMLLSNIYNDLLEYCEYFKMLEKIEQISEAIKDVLKQVHNEFIKIKRDNNFLDFSDLNHLAISALTIIENTS